MIDAYGELVDEGCLAVFGPNITDNVEPTKVEIERRFEVPALSVTGSEAWLGPWTFSLPMGSLTDEPVFWVEQMLANALRNRWGVGRTIASGNTYIVGFREACARGGIRIVSEQMIPQTAQDITEQVTRLHAERPDAIVHCGFGFGMAMTNMILSNPSIGIHRGTWTRCSRTRGSTTCCGRRCWDGRGVDQYDEENRVGQGLLDEFDEKVRSATRVLRARRELRRRQRVRPELSPTPTH